MNVPCSEQRTILLVEDDEVMRSTVQELLESDGYHVLSACSGEDAVRIYRDSMRTINVVVTDMCLPGMDGQQTFMKIRELNPVARVILATGSMDPKLKTELSDAGLAEYVQKPYKFEELESVLQSVMDH